MAHVCPKQLGFCLVLKKIDFFCKGWNFRELRQRRSGNEDGRLLTDGTEVLLLCFWAQLKGGHLVS